MSKRVLVVEDERIVAEDIAQCLEERGYEVVGLASSGEQAIKLAESTQPDLALMDIVIQGDRDGIETAHVLKERFGISVVYLTAYSQEKTVARAKETEPLGYVVKPFEEATLLSTVEIALHKQGLYKQLAAGREWFYTTLRSVTDGVIATDNEGLIVFMNKAAEELTGWKMTDAEGVPVIDVYRSVDEAGEPAPNPALRALELQKNVDAADNTVLLSKDEEGRCVEDSGSLIRNTDDGVLGAILAFRDITEKKFKSKQLIRYQKHLEELVSERTAELRRRIDLESLISSMCVHLTKSDPEELEIAIGEAVGKLASYVGAPTFVVLQERSQEILGDLPCELGSYSPDLVSQLGDFLWSGNQWVEDQLAERGHFLVPSRAALAGTCSRELEAFENMEVEGLLGLPLGLDDLGRCWGMITFVSGEPLELDIHDIRIMSVLCEIVHHSLQRRTSERERLSLTESLNQSQKLEAIGKLSGGIAHDFNNMLVPIIGYSDFILEHQGMSFGNRQELIEIRKAAESAASLTKQLLAFSRKQILEKDRLNLNQTVEHLRNMLQRILGEDVDLDLDLESDLWGVEADRGQLEQVIMNLCVNARHAMPDGGRIRVSTANVTLRPEDPDQPSGAFVKLTVRDEGCGMDRELMDRIFDPFYTTKGQDGTGLGLSVVLGIIDQHGGWIHVDSKVGQGSIFEVYLPSDRRVCRVKTSAASMTGSLEDRQGVDRILLVEDEPSVLAFVQQALKKAGFQVTPAASAKAALAAYDEHGGAFDMIFTDAVLPDGTGMEVLEDLLGRNPALKALLSSGYTDARALLDKAMDRHIPFLHKPYSLAELYEKLREVIHAPSPASRGVDVQETSGSTSRLP